MSDTLVWVIIILFAISCSADDDFEKKCLKADSHAIALKTTSGNICVRSLDQIKLPKE